MNICSDEVTMSSVQNLRELINERLTAAAEEIFREFEKTIVQYEEEIDRQRRLLDNIWKPQITQHTAVLPQVEICNEEDNNWKLQITLHTTELPLQQICKEEEVPAEQNVCNQERNSSVDQEDPEPPQMKEEHMEICTNLDQEDLEPPELKEEHEELCNSLDRQQSGQTAAADTSQKADSFMLVQYKSKCEELAREKFSISEDTIGHYEEATDCHRRPFNITKNLQIKLHRIDLQQQHIYEEQVFTDHSYCKQERSFCLDQKDPDRPQIKEAQEKLCISRDQDILPQIKEEQKELYCSQEREQLDAFIGISAHEESDCSEPEPISGQLLSHRSRLAESSDQEGSKRPNSGSTNNLVMKTHDRNSSHSNNVESSSISQIHCDADTGKKTEMCDVCGKAFKCKFNFKRHYKIHTGEKPFTCETCGKSFTRSQHVTNHMRTHTGEKLYLCQVCGKRFSDLVAFQMHRAIHKDQNLHYCKICDKSFTQRSNFRVHMKGHTGQKLYACKICEKRFVRSTHFKDHMKVHTGERSLSCKICGQNFIQNGNLKVHMRIHTGEKPYCCNTCGKSFRYKRSLLSHMRVHTDEKPNLCNRGVKI
ncbi:zinc finger protein 239-like isoform X1 [Acanthochromis polyacanthus]|uniref:zinc finger protein 239-like isoform X1 n=1 Tax=Acanthochromis polyacanthus TaxID=80966 RepID=UPI0022346AE5|nr:zinc finger protein 239-like isoform X1 [Acanthochromis polyacanthus]